MRDNKKFGIRIPRSVLLPPYLKLSPYFEEFTDGIDHTFKTTIDEKIRVLENLRNMWVTNPSLEYKVVEQEILASEDWSMPERSLLAQQVNMLGMKLKTANVLPDDAYHRLTRFLGMYWFEKGTEKFIDFINFCTNSDIRIYRLWSENTFPGQYTNMTREVNGEPPGTPVWEGGTWYPTSHVDLEVDSSSLRNLDLETLTEFFYEIANYNLVLNTIEDHEEMDIVPDHETEDTEIVAMAMYLQDNRIMSTEGRYGGYGPDIHEMEKLSFNYLSNAPADENAFLLTTPEGWFTDNEGRRFPTYMVGRTPQVFDTIPFKVQCEIDLDNPILLRGNFQLIRIPGARFSSGRMPALVASGVQQYTSDTFINRCYDNTSYLANPKGWVSLVSGTITPYW